MSADYYPLKDFSQKDNVWMAIKYGSPEKGECCIIYFRRANSAFSEVGFHLLGIVANANYKRCYFKTGK